MLFCKICNKDIVSLKGLNIHIKKKHPEVSLSDYYDEFLIY